MVSHGAGEAGPTVVPERRRRLQRAGTERLFGPGRVESEIPAAGAGDGPAREGSESDLVKLEGSECTGLIPAGGPATAHGG